MATLPTDGYNISDYRRLAAKARGEFKKDPRQAAEKSYLAAVHAARQILACAGVEWKSGKRQSSAAIGRAANVLGESGLGADEFQPITRAFTLALGQHSACFYDGVCERSAVWDAVTAVDTATGSLDRVCRRLISMRPVPVDEFAGTARPRRRRG